MVITVLIRHIVVLFAGSDTDETGQSRAVSRRRATRA